VLRTARPPRRLLLYVILTSGVLAALLVNDMICFIFTPLVVVVVRGDLPLLAYPLALATSAILGSVANIIGVEPARDHVEVGFWNYAKFGFPVTGLTTAAGMLILAVSS
jgi:Na+/H+ antiporter NhaD/arsenite permease-like protein